jgi:hypothetical protein
MKDMDYDEATVDYKAALEGLQGEKQMEVQQQLRQAEHQRKQWNGGERYGVLVVLDGILYTRMLTHPTITEVEVSMRVVSSACLYRVPSFLSDAFIPIGCLHSYRFQHQSCQNTEGRTGIQTALHRNEITLRSSTCR